MPDMVKLTQAQNDELMLLSVDTRPYTLFELLIIISQNATLYPELNKWLFTHNFKQSNANQVDLGFLLQNKEDGLLIEIVE